jgi:hypothetical protein
VEEAGVVGGSKGRVGVGDGEVKISEEGRLVDGAVEAVKERKNGYVGGNEGEEEKKKDVPCEVTECTRQNLGMKGTIP